MKRFLLLVFVGSLVTINAKSQVETMQALEKSMATIQEGFLYNNVNGVEKGVQSLLENLQDIKAFKINHEKDKTFNAKEYALKESSAITKLAKETLTLFKSSKKDEALQTYTQILNRCTICHKIVRKW